MSKLTPNQQKWVDVLRSGEFEQGRGALDCGGSYCCLGVACVLADRNGVPVQKAYGEQTVILGKSLRDQADVLKWIGLRHPFGVTERGGTRLSQLNDKGTPFSEIADIIEAHADELFVSPVAEERT